MSLIGTRLLYFQKFKSIKLSDYSQFIKEYDFSNFPRKPQNHTDFQLLLIISQTTPRKLSNTVCNLQSWLPLRDQYSCNLEGALECQEKAPKAIRL